MNPHGDETTGEAPLQGIRDNRFGLPALKGRAEGVILTLAHWETS